MVIEIIAQRNDDHMYKTFPAHIRMKRILRIIPAQTFHFQESNHELTWIFFLLLSQKKNLTGYTGGSKKRNI